MMVYTDCHMMGLKLCVGYGCLTVQSKGIALAHTMHTSTLMPLGMHGVACMA